MPHAHRVKWLHGPYRALAKGDRAFCLLRDCEVIITGWTDAPIPWDGVSLWTGSVTSSCSSRPATAKRGQDSIDSTRAKEGNSWTHFSASPRHYFGTEDN
jgi:hypothetical protein